MSYELLKAGHIVAVMVWFGGTLAVALLLKQGGNAAALRNWDRCVTTPAMVASWALGLTMATWVGWFANGWMMVKLVFVLALSAVHGVLSGRLRRTGTSHSTPSGTVWRLMPSIMLITLCAIVLLVIMKPL